MFERNTERHGFPGGLRAQLLIGLGLLVVGTMALVALVGAQLTRRQVERSELRATAADARHLANLKASGTHRTLIESYRDTAELAYIRFERPDGATAVGSFAGDAPAKLLEQLYTSQSEAPAAAIRRFSGTPYAVAVATWQTDGRTSHAMAVRSLADAHGRISAAREMLLAYLGIDALFILIVGYAYLTYLVVRPIRAIGVATRRAARGDLASHIELLPNNEFGRVGRSFNRMLDELHDNRRELEERLEELDRAYRELEQTQESLIRSEKMASVGQLAAGVAHEIGNPLSAISGYLDLLDDSDLAPEKRREILERMRNQVDRMQTIIRDLLDFSRDENQDSPIGPVELSDCLEEASDLLAPQPTARKVELVADIPDDLPRVSGNADQIVQVLVNLLMNAAEAIGGRETAGTITIGAEADSERVRLQVSDDGPGLDPAEQERIFEPFYTSKDSGDGTGLGLAIAHRIMGRFDGSISVESAESGGATFELEFPRADIEGA